MHSGALSALVTLLLTISMTSLFTSRTTFLAAAAAAEGDCIDCGAAVNSDLAEVDYQMFNDQGTGPLSDNRQVGVLFCFNYNRYMPNINLMIASLMIVV